MPDISEHPSTSVTKMLLIGESGTGKTGALASLAAAGYNLRIIDLDNGIDILRSFIMKPGGVYAKAKEPGRVVYQTLTERMKQVAGQVIPTKADVWERTVQVLERWAEYQLDDKGMRIVGEDKKPIILRDLGRLTDWTNQEILVIDSLTMLATAAYNFDKKMQGKMGQSYTQNEHRRAIGRAQGLVENLLQMLYDKSVPCNVIVTSHITYVRDNEALGDVIAPSDDEDKSNAFPKKGYPSALGVSLSPRIPRYFNSVLYTRTMGAGTAARQKIYTRPMGIVNVKSSAPASVKAEYPIETGLADYFRDVRS